MAKIGHTSDTCIADRRHRRPPAHSGAEPVNAVTPKSIYPTTAPKDFSAKIACATMLRKSPSSAAFVIPFVGACVLLLVAVLVGGAREVSATNSAAQYVAAPIWCVQALSTTRQRTEAYAASSSGFRGRPPSCVLGVRFSSCSPLSHSSVSRALIPPATAVAAANASSFPLPSRKLRPERQSL